MPFRRRSIQATAFRYERRRNQDYKVPIIDPNLPRMTMWVDDVQGDPSAWKRHPCYVLAPIVPEFRKALEDHKGIVAREVKLSIDAPVTALVLYVRGLFPAELYALHDSEFTFCETPYVGYGWMTDWIGMTRDMVWTSGLGKRDAQVLSEYVRLLHRLDHEGRPIVPEPQGEIPEDDEAALKTLGF